ncbi:MAG TPA: hypothetical protein VFE14_04590, partial [Micromonosporaceae bacterium]|nr:hypothetical protein [Micromonosporaceae bacterium]
MRLRLAPAADELGQAPPILLFSTMYRRAVRETRRIIVVVAAVPLIVPLFMLTVFSRAFEPLVNAAGFQGADNYVQ